MTRKNSPVTAISGLLRPSHHKHTAEISYNPAAAARKDAEASRITLFEYAPEGCKEIKLEQVQDIANFSHEHNILWIDVEGIVKDEVETICRHFGIDALIIEDILSMGQRPKMDEMDNAISCLLSMLYFNDSTGMVEQEQVSILLGENFVLSFQEDLVHDLFEPIRKRLRTDGSRLRNLQADYLYYMLLDSIVDNYFVVMEKIGEKIEALEDVLPHRPNTQILVRISAIRREIFFLRKKILPVREIINGIQKTDSSLINDNAKKYFKDIYDHIVQATEMVESYRDMTINLQDLYLNNMDLRMNEIMKVLTVVTSLITPLTLITGIYGMNFANMPELRTHYGYFVCLGVMGCILLGMLIWFKRKGWF